MTTTPPARPLRVAVLDHTAALGGAELALVRLLDHLEDVEAHTVLFSDGPLAATLRARGHPVEILPLSPALATTDRHAAGRSPLVAARNAARVLPFAIRLGRHLRRLNPDVVHTTSLKADLIGIPAAWIARRPLVWHVHDRVSPDYLPAPLVRLLRLLARLVPRHVVVNSAATAATLPGVRRLTVAHPGFSAEQVGPAPAERNLPEPPVVGLVGRISPTKGQLVLVRAAARVLRERPAVRFRLIGDALFGEEDYAAAVRREAGALGIADRVEFPGFVADVAAELDALTLCVHASPTPEPFGQVVVEAMIRGVPVVATRGGGVTEIVAPDDAGPPLGWLVPPGDDAALAAAIVAALTDPDEARRRAGRARESALRRFPVTRTAEAVSEVWRGVVCRGRCRRPRRRGWRGRRAEPVRRARRTCRR